MHKDIEHQMEIIDKTINETLRKVGLELDISDIHFIEKRASDNTAPAGANAKEKATDAKNKTTAAAEECWKWQCFPIPTGTRCIKVRC